MSFVVSNCQVVVVVVVVSKIQVYIHMLFFQISAIRKGVGAYMHATILVVETAERFLGQSLYG